MLTYLDSWKLFEGFDRNNIDKFSKRNRGSLTVFHRTKDTSIDLIGRDGYRAGGGDVWGPGVYACYDLISTTKANKYNEGHLKSSTYGPVIIENKVASLKNFLIFDYDVAKKVYGNEYKLEDQLKKILPENIYQKFEEVILEASQICDNLYKKSPMNKYTTEAVGKIYILPEIRHYLRGMIFTGAFDGKVLLNYDRENLIPINYSKDDGKTWKKFRKQGIHRMARENLHKLLKSNSKDLSTYLQDHINNKLTAGQFKSFSEYLEKTMSSSNFNDLDILSDFEYIFDLKEEEYPNIKSIKSQISNLYKDYIVRIINTIKDTNETDIALLNSNLFVTLPEKIEKYFPSLMNDYNSSFEIYLGKIIDGVKKSQENKDLSNSIVQLSNHLSYLNVENFKNFKDKFTELKNLTSEVLREVSDFSKLNNEVVNEIKKYCETYKDVKNLEEESTSEFKSFFELQKEITNKLNVLSGNTKVIKYLKNKSDGTNYLNFLDERGVNSDYIRLTWNLALLPNETIDKLEEIFKVKIIDSNYGSPLMLFFDNYSESLEKVEIKNLFDKKIKSLSKYLDEDFITSLNKSYIKPELKFQLLVNSKNLNDESKSSLLYCFFQSDKWRPLLKKLKEINYTVDSNIKTGDSGSGSYLIEEIFNSKFDSEKLMEMREIFTEDLFLQILTIGHYTGYIKNLDDNLLQKIKTKLQDESFCFNLIDCVKKQSLRKPDDRLDSLSPTEVLSMVPIKLSLIIKSGKLDEDKLRYFAENKLEKVIDGGDIKKIEAFILFLIENGLKFNYLSKLEDVDFSQLKSDTLFKMLSSKFLKQDIILRILKDQKIKNDNLVKYCISNEIQSEYLFKLTDNIELKKQISQQVIDNLSKGSQGDLITSIMYSFTDENMAKILKYIESLSSSSDAEDNEKVGPIAFIILILSKDKDNTYQKLNTKIKDSITEVVTEWSQNLDSIWKELEGLSEYNKDVTLVNTCKAFQLVVNSIKDESVKSNLESFIQKNLKVSEKRILNFSNFNWS
jgi:hypothetical protein